MLSEEAGSRPAALWKQEVLLAWERWGRAGWRKPHFPPPALVPGRVEEEKSTAGGSEARETRPPALRGPQAHPRPFASALSPGLCKADAAMPAPQGGAPRAGQGTEHGARSGFTHRNVRGDPMAPRPRAGGGRRAGAVLATGARAGSSRPRRTQWRRRQQAGGCPHTWVGAAGPLGRAPGRHAVPVLHGWPPRAPCPALQAPAWAEGPTSGGSPDPVC